MNDYLLAKDRGHAWETRHNDAVLHPRGPERDFTKLVSAWIDYETAYRSRWGARIGEDGYTGPVWARIGAELRQLLSTDLGRLDGGTLDKAICSLMEANEFDPVDY